MTHQPAAFGKAGLPAIVAQPSAMPASAPATESGMDLFTLLAALRRQWRTLAAVLFLVVAAAAAWAWSLTPLYTATAEVLITPRQKALVGGGLISPGLSSELMMIESQARIIASEAVLRRVVKEQGLDTDPEFDGSRPDTSLRARLRSFLGESEPRAATDPAETALRSLARRLSVRRAEKTFVLEISVTSEDPAKAARLANAVAAAYIADQTQTRATTAGQVNTLLARRLDVLRRNLAEAEEKVATFKRRHDIVATKKGQLENEARLARLGEELVKARARAAAAKARYDSVRAALAAGAAPEATAAAVASPVISRLRADHARAAARAASLSQTLGPRHPRLLAARAEARRISRLIRDELSRLARSMRAEYLAAQEEVKAMERNLQRVKKSASLTNEARVRLRALEREAAARRKVFEAFLLKAKESGEARKLQLPDARIISPAVPPQHPSWPKKKLVLGLAGLLGLGLGAALALMRDFRARPPAATPMPAATLRATGARAASAGTGHGGEEPAAPPAPPPPPLPLLASLPTLPGMEGHEGDAILHLVHEAMNTPVGARQAAFSTAISHMARTIAPWGVTAVSTPQPGQGGTTLAWALALSLARQGRRVLLVDANQADPHLSRVLRPDAAPRLRSVLLGRTAPRRLVAHDPALGLAFLSLALPERFAPARGELDAFHAWLEGLFRLHDSVIIDATPISLATDPFGLVDLVDGIVLCAAPWAAGSAELRTATALIAESALPAAMAWSAAPPPDAPAPQEKTP